MRVPISDRLICVLVRSNPAGCSCWIFGACLLLAPVRILAAAPQLYSQAAYESPDLGPANLRARTIQPSGLFVLDLRRLSVAGTRPNPCGSAATLQPGRL